MTDPATPESTIGDFSGPFDEQFGLRFTEMSGDKVVAEWTATPKHHQPHGIVHGGVHTSIVETLGSLGSSLWYGDRGTVVGLSNLTDFYRGVSTGEMVSTATPVHRGRSQQVWVVETHDAAGRLVARGQLRVQNLQGR
jgi:1,4-dihydroxy-2-naphthoyl-CoA hydrolase